MAAQTRANAELASVAFEMIAPTTDPAMLAVNKWAARVVGWAGTEGLEARLLELMNKKELRVYAALAITLGGDEDLVRRGMVLFRQQSLLENRWDFDLSTLRSLYLDTFESRAVTSYDIDSGRVFRFVRNAELMRRAGASDEGGLGVTPHEWASAYLQAGLQRLDLNATIPGGVSRLIVRAKLNRAAKSPDEKIKNSAIDTLRFLKEQGSIMALRNEPGLTGELAKQAFFKMRNPNLGVVISEKNQEKQEGVFSKPRK